MDYVEGLSFAILVNGASTEYFHSTVELCQGCLLFPYLFILCANALSRALRTTVQGSELEPYWSTPEA